METENPKTLHFSVSESCINLTINLTPAFGILWTAVAGFIAYSHYKNAFTNEGMATHEIVIDENDDTYSAVSGTSDDEDIEVKLKKLESLYLSERYILQ